MTPHLYHRPDLPELVAARLQTELPSHTAARQFAPELSYGRHAGPAPHSARLAAVLVLLYQRQGAWHLPLMLRPNTMLAHASQVSFPGGLIELDETPETCAVREFVEELGPATAEVIMLGRLSPIYIFGSNFQVTPCVAVSRYPLEFTPNPLEVAEVLEVPVQDLLDPAVVGRNVRTRYGVRYCSPHLESCGHQIWGATCLMLAEFQSLLTQSADESSLVQKGE